MIYLDTSVLLAHVLSLHLASADFLRRQGVSVRVATYDARMRSAAEAIGLPLLDLT